MAHELVRPDARALARAGLQNFPAIVVDAGDDATRRFVEFFTAEIRNPNTRAAYARAVGRFLQWAEGQGFELEDLEPVHVAAYVELLQRDLAAPSVKQHLAAVRMMFDYLVTGGVLRVNPAAAVRGPKHVVKTGKTPVLDADQARQLLVSIDTSTTVGLRDRALIGVMVYSFARVGAVVSMAVQDYFQSGKRWSFRLHEKGGKFHQVPAHHSAEAYVDAYLERAGLRDTPKAPLFQTVDRRRRLCGTSQSPSTTVESAVETTRSRPRSFRGSSRTSRLILRCKPT